MLAGDVLSLADDGTVTALDPVWTDPSVRMDEGGCDPGGRFWCGSMAHDKRPGGGSLPARPRRIRAPGAGGRDDLQGRPGVEPRRIAHLLRRHRDLPVDVFDYDPVAGLTGRWPFVALTGGERPDGLTVDADGGVWMAMNGSGVVHRYRADGVLDGVVRLPTAQVTACTFGGPGLDQLLITTSREGLAPDDDPIADSLFRADAGVTGLPVREFVG
jgi:sugar lactone lactonase YvrE